MKKGILQRVSKNWEEAKMGNLRVYFREILVDEAVTNVCLF